MTNEEIESGNKMIQQWLYENIGVGFWSNEPLMFYKDYGWIMPVVERIEQYTEARFQIYARAVDCVVDYGKWQICNDAERKSLEINILFNRGSEYIPFEKLHAIYKCVLAYVGWSNSRKLNKETVENEQKEIESENPNAKYMRLQFILDKHWLIRNKSESPELILSGNDEEMIYNAMLEFSSEKNNRITELENAIKEYLEADGSISSARLYDLINE